MMKSDEDNVSTYEEDGNALGHNVCWVRAKSSRPAAEGR